MSRPLTLPEAADQLRKSKRWLLEWLRQHPLDKAGSPYFTPVGRDKIFHQADIARIELALREDLKCPSPSARRATAKRRISKSAGPISASEWKLAAELTNDPSLLPSSEKSRTASKLTGNIPRPNLKLIQGSRLS
jgi:hypothetical protein